MEQGNLHHHHMTHQQKSWHLKVVLRHVTAQPIRYQTYHMTRIKIQVFQIIFRQIHLTHQTTIIINKDNVQTRKKIVE